MEPTAYIAIYSAIVATVALLWNVFNAYSGHRGRIRIERYRTIGRDNGTFKVSVICKVTNIGRTTRHIERPVLAFKNPRVIPREPDANLLFLQPDDKAQYPRELKPGEIYEIEIDLEWYYQQVFSTLDSNVQLLFRVRDTHGKTYCTDIFQVGEIRRDVIGARAINMRGEARKPT